MKAVRVVRHSSGAVEEIPITASLAEIDQLVLDGWEIEYSWTAMDYVCLIAWSLLGIGGGVAVGALLGGLITPGP